jgi:predicted tellurium resistance membrane protein TerC
MSASDLQKSFASTITAIALMDLSLSLDNVVAAIALAHDKPWAVYVGVTIGIISLRLVAGFALKMIERYPVLEHTAFVLIGYVGILLMVELQLHVAIPKAIKFGGIIIIIGLSILWSENKQARAVLTPVLRVFVLPMELFAVAVGSVFQLLTWPVRKLLGLFAN